MITATATKSAKTEVHQSDWGFHPCDRATCKKLKEVHKLLLRAYRDCKRNIRWNNKDPQNQKGPEPKAPKNFIEHGYHQRGEHTFYGLGFRKYNRANLYSHILQQYQNARYPVERPVDVVQLDLPPNLDKIVEELREFYAE